MLLEVTPSRWRRPARILAAIRRCRAAGKPVILMFSGPQREIAGRPRNRPHGALVGDYATMRTQVEDAGAIRRPPWTR